MAGMNVRRLAAIDSYGARGASRGLWMAGSGVIFVPLSLVGMAVRSAFARRAGPDR
jgi:hypothetical protein